MNLNPIAQTIANQYGRYNWRPKFSLNTYVWVLMSYRRLKQ